MEGFIPIQMVNAELKFCVFIIAASIIVGIIWIRVHLASRVIAIGKSISIFGIIFLSSVFISTLFAHNFERALVSSFTWHVLPVFLGFSLLQLKWTTGRLHGFISLLLLGGLLSCLVVMDQHYLWTDWSHRLPRAGYGGLIYNQNFAAEYHAPLLPLALSLVFLVKSKLLRLFFLGSLLFVFLPALSLSLARGAWVGLMGGSFITGCLFILLLSKSGKMITAGSKKKLLGISFSFILLAITLPIYLLSSDLWKKDSFSEKSSATHIQSSEEALELKSITTISHASGGSGRRIVLWKDALEAVMSKYFLLGRGTDHYELHFHESAKRSDQTTGSTLVRFTHNDFLQILYENGIVGLIGFLGLWIAILREGLKRALAHASEKNLSNVTLILGLIASCLTFLIESFFEFPTRSPCAMIVGWSTLGLLLVLSRQKSGNLKPPEIIMIGPKCNLFIGALALWIIPFGWLLSKNLFWTNIYHFQGRIAGDYGQKDQSLRFHRKSIEYAPWEHHSRKFECYYLLSHKKQFPEALEAINQTLAMHPGCLVAYQNKIAISVNEFKDYDMAKEAYFDMKRVAPYHPFTKQEGQKLSQLKP